MEYIVKKFNDLSLEELYEILKIRCAVFVVEQNCPYQDIDELDKNSYHICIKEDNKVVAYCRVIDKNNPFHEVSIGRVISVVRRKGYGTLLVQKGIDIAKEKYNANKIIIEAQTYARRLYEKVGFKQISEPFLEDGIEHIKMCYEKGE